jgi:HD-GYP domain-containing protein (c-di-GMP phosphodiesterase class II)
MVLARAVYDNFGQLLIKEGTHLNNQQIITLNDTGVAELFILDRRVDDVPAWPLITPELVGNIAHALRTLTGRIRLLLATGQAQEIDIMYMKSLAHDMVQQLFPVAMGEPVICGCPGLKDYDYVHPVHVASISMLLGKSAGMDEKQIMDLGMAALLQNIGYAAIPQAVLDGEWDFSEDNFRVVKMHSAYGAEIVRRYGHVNQDVINMIYQHHERWNGTGYPHGLKGQSISPGARIIAVTDTACALVSKRPFRGAVLTGNSIPDANATHGKSFKQDYMHPHQAIDFLQANSGSLFDPEVVKLMALELPPYPCGVTVKLNTGETAIVCNSQTGIYARPEVRVIYDKYSREIGRPFDLNLADKENQEKLIVQVLDY